MDNNYFYFLVPHLILSFFLQIAAIIALRSTIWDSKIKDCIVCLLNLKAMYNNVTQYMQLIFRAFSAENKCALYMDKYSTQVCELN